MYSIYHLFKWFKNKDISNNVLYYMLLQNLENRSILGSENLILWCQKSDNYPFNISHFCPTNSLLKTVLYSADSFYLLKFSRRCLQSSVATSCNVRLHLSFLSASSPPWLQRISRQFCKGKNCIIYLSICCIKEFYQYEVRLPIEVLTHVFPKIVSYGVSVYKHPNDAPRRAENQE